MTEPSAGPEAPESPLSRRSRRQAAEASLPRVNIWPFFWSALGVILITAGVLWWFIFRGAEAEEPESWHWVEEPLDGVHAREVPSEDWETGWCLRGFTDEEATADVVDCERDYDAQVVFRRNISDGPYPGDTTVIDTAHQWCEEEAAVDSEAVAESAFPLEMQLWHPTESTWRRDYDRMVSCFITRSDDSLMTGTFLAAEEAGAASEDADEDTGEDAEPTENQDDDGASG